MHKFLILLPVILILISSGCTVQQLPPDVDEPGGVCSVDPQSTCAAPTEVLPVLYGAWVGEGEVIGSITINSESVLIEEQLLPENDRRESTYEIQSVDWARDVVTMKLNGVRVNGEDTSFDSAVIYMKVWIDDVTLFYSLGDEGEGIPGEASIGPFKKQ